MFPYALETLVLMSIDPIPVLKSAGSPPYGKRRYSSLHTSADTNNPSKEGEEKPSDLDNPATALNTVLYLKLSEHRS